MDGQVYLLMVKKTSSGFKSMPAPAKVQEVLSKFMHGDSLDIPFLKFIRVQSVDHSLGMPSGGPSLVVQEGTGENAYARELKAEPSMVHSDDDYDARSKRMWYTKDTSEALVDTASQMAALRNNNAGYGSGWDFGGSGRKSRWFSKAQNLNVKLPDHGDLSFTKWADNATPQLACACAAQEPISWAAFFFRRRIGPGVMGVRLPYLCIIVEQCLISGWEFAGSNTEKVTLKYKRITWASIDQFADTNAPTMLTSTRTWDAAQKEGGETSAGQIVPLILVALTAAAGAVAAAVGDGVTKG